MSYDEKDTTIVIPEITEKEINSEIEEIFEIPEEVDALEAPEQLEPQS